MNVLETKPNCEAFVLRDEGSCAHIDLGEDRIIVTSHDVDMVICSGKIMRSKGDIGYGYPAVYTRLVNIPDRQIVNLGVEDIIDSTDSIPPRGWEKKLVQKQMAHIERMIDQIHMGKLRTE